MSAKKKPSTTQSTNPNTETQMAKVTWGLSETIPTVQFGNIVLGPISVEMFVDNNEESISEGLKTVKSLAHSAFKEARNPIKEKIVELNKNSQ